MSKTQLSGERMQFRYGSAKVAKLMPEYESCRGFLNSLKSPLPHE